MQIFANSPLRFYNMSLIRQGVKKDLFEKDIHLNDVHVSDILNVWKVASHESDLPGST